MEEFIYTPGLTKYISAIIVPDLAFFDFSAINRISHAPINSNNTDQNFIRKACNAVETDNLFAISPVNHKQY
jgi:hypothetical protein